MPRFTPELVRLLLIKGISRALLPLSVLWGIFDWCFVDWRYAMIFAVLSVNYPLVYALSWTAPAFMNGPWRIRPWQTFILLINAVVLPIYFHRACGRPPYGFIGITIVAFIGLFVSTQIHMHLNERLPMSGVFAKQRQRKLDGVFARSPETMGIASEAPTSSSGNPA